MKILKILKILISVMPIMGFTDYFDRCRIEQSVVNTFSDFSNFFDVSLSFESI